MLNGFCFCSLVILHPGRGAAYCDRFVCVSVSLCVCLSVCLSVREHISGTARPIFTNFLCRSPVAVARFSFGSIAIRYVLPVMGPARAYGGRCDAGAESGVYECLVCSCFINIFCFWMCGRLRLVGF